MRTGGDKLGLEHILILTLHVVQGPRTDDEQKLMAGLTLQPPDSFPELGFTEFNPLAEVRAAATFLLRKHPEASCVEFIYGNGLAKNAADQPVIKPSQQENLIFYDPTSGEAPPSNEDDSTIVAWAESPDPQAMVIELNLEPDADTISELPVTGEMQQRISQAVGAAKKFGVYIVIHHNNILWEDVRFSNALSPRSLAQSVKMLFKNQYIDREPAKMVLASCTTGKERDNTISVLEYAKELNFKNTKIGAYIYPMQVEMDGRKTSDRLYPKLPHRINDLSNVDEGTHDYYEYDYRSHKYWLSNYKGIATYDMQNDGWALVSQLDGYTDGVPPLFAREYTANLLGTDRIAFEQPQNTFHGMLLHNQINKAYLLDLVSLTAQKPIVRVLFRAAEEEKLAALEDKARDAHSKKEKRITQKYADRKEKIPSDLSESERAARLALLQQEEEKALSSLESEFQTEMKEIDEIKKRWNVEGQSRLHPLMDTDTAHPGSVWEVTAHKNFKMITSVGAMLTQTQMPMTNAPKWMKSPEDSENSELVMRDEIIASSAYMRQKVRTLPSQVARGEVLSRLRNAPDQIKDAFAELQPYSDEQLSGLCEDYVRNMTEAQLAAYISAFKGASGNIVEEVSNSFGDYLKARNEAIDQLMNSIFAAHESYMKRQAFEEFLRHMDYHATLKSWANPEDASAVVPEVIVSLRTYLTSNSEVLNQALATRLEKLGTDDHRLVADGYIKNLPNQIDQMDLLLATKDLNEFNFLEYIADRYSAAPPTLNLASKSRHWRETYIAEQFDPNKSMPNLQDEPNKQALLTAYLATLNDRSLRDLARDVNVAQKVHDDLDAWFGQTIRDRMANVLHAAYQPYVPRQTLMNFLLNRSDAEFSQYRPQIQSSETLFIDSIKDLLDAHITTLGSPHIDQNQITAGSNGLATRAGLTLGEQALVADYISSQLPNTGQKVRFLLDAQAKNNDELMMSVFETHTNLPAHIVEQIQRDKENVLRTNLRNVLAATATGHQTLGPHIRDPNLVIDEFVAQLDAQQGTTFAYLSPPNLVAAAVPKFENYLNGRGRSFTDRLRTIAKAMGYPSNVTIKPRNIYELNLSATAAFRVDRDREWTTYVTAQSAQAGVRAKQPDFIKIKNSDLDAALKRQGETNNSEIKVVLAYTPTHGLRVSPYQKRPTQQSTRGGHTASGSRGAARGRGAGRGRGRGDGGGS